MQQKFRFKRLTSVAALTATFLLAGALAHGGVSGGRIILKAKDFRPGASLDLSGHWLYKPGYAVATGESPESESSATGFVPVGVPQFLNKVGWWLDDSVDFNKHELERLARLGFDTDRAEDGWYRLEVNLPSVPPHRRIFIEFDGVAMRCKVFCNGKFQGDHQGMFSRFACDLTESLRAGANNLAVFVAMEKNYESTASMGQAVTVNLTASKVKTLSKGMYGPWAVGKSNRDYDLHGIWQPVRLVVRGDGKIDDVWFIPSTNGAEVRVKGRVFESQPASLEVKWTNDKTGRTFACLGAPLLEVSGRTFSNMLNLRDAHPKLWTPSEPNLYRLQVKLVGGDGELLDEWSEKVGFRTFEIRGNRFFVNGHPWWLRGADHLPYGKNPWDPQLPRKLIQYLHDGNINITRTHCTPWNEAWLEAADEIGLGVSIEGIRPWALSGQIGPTPPDLMQEWLRENQDVIERCRNHPSVFIYTVGNEMMLRDSKNVEKWKQLSDVVKQTRRIDPTRPVIASSEYQRDPEFYSTVLKPNDVDDGDIDDLHRYNNWYGPSSFVSDSKFVNEMKRNQGLRPLMGQEMSTGYPSLDNGLPVTYYTRDLIAPQAWVGIDAYPGSDPAIFLEHHRAVTKRWAELLRFQRSTNTAGFMLFAAECWFSHSYDPNTLKPYPVYEAMREADAPIGLAWEMGRRRFYAGEVVDTAVFVSNDDDSYRDYHNVALSLSIPGHETIALARITNLPYGTTIRVPVTARFPSISAEREKVVAILQLTDGWKHIGETKDPIEIFPRREVMPVPSSVITIERGESLDGLAPGEELRRKIENGATAIIFSPGSKIARLFPEAVRESKSFVGEFADLFPVAGTPLAMGLQPMDLKWWGRTNDWRVFVASQAQRLQTNGMARELIRFIPAHGYTALDKLPEQYWSVLWQMRLGRGRLWVCDLDLDACASVDPAAALFRENLLRAAADANSTSHLPRIPTHEELMLGRNKNY
jgi:hypothetical protein